jgi:hypothetical protein
MGKIESYRQPMVTATGIFLGFLLDFTSSWLSSSFTKYRYRDMVVAVGVTACIALLMVVLFRILNMNHPVDQVELYYQRTLRLFLIAVSIPFIDFILIIILRLFYTPA